MKGGDRHESKKWQNDDVVNVVRWVEIHAKQSRKEKCLLLLAVLGATGSRGKGTINEKERRRSNTYGTYLKLSGVLVGQRLSCLPHDK